MFSFFLYIPLEVFFEREKARVIWNIFSVVKIFVCPMIMDCLIIEIESERIMHKRYILLIVVNFKFYYDK